MRKKQALDKDVLMVASDIAKKSRAYLNWHEGKGYASGFSLHQFRSALAEFADFMERYEQQAE